MRVPLYTAKTGFTKRLRSYLSFAASASRRGPRLCRRPDLLFVESPPLFIGYAARYLSWRWKCPFVFNVSDLWPESAIRMGIVKPGLATRMAERLERKLYRKRGGSDRPVGRNRRRRAAVRAGRSEPEVITNGVDPRRFGRRAGRRRGSRIARPRAGADLHFRRICSAWRKASIRFSIWQNRFPTTCRGDSCWSATGPSRDDLQRRIEAERIGRVRLVPAQAARADSRPVGGGRRGGHQLGDVDSRRRAEQDLRSDGLVIADSARGRWRAGAARAGSGLRLDGRARRSRRPSRRIPRAGHRRRAAQATRRLRAAAAETVYNRDRIAERLDRFLVQLLAHRR